MNIAIFSTVFSALFIVGLVVVLRLARDLPGARQLVAPIEQRLTEIDERLVRIEERLPVVVAGRYRLARKIGEGGTGEVWQAYDEALRDDVAIKIVHEHLGDDLSSDRLIREARVAAKLRHPSIVTMLDVGEHAGQVYLAMELLRGVTLRDVPLPLPLPQVMRVGEQVAGALCAAAQYGMVHRDLKPDNICVEDEGRRFVVVDFGLAFLETGDGLTQTEDGPITGTPHYMSPEQARNDDVGPPTDIYALGCTLYELATGRPPFDRPSVASMFVSHAQDPRPVLGGHEELARLLVQMMAINPAHRPTAEAVRSILRRMRAESCS